MIALHRLGHAEDSFHLNPDLIVTVEVDVPAQLTDEQRTAVEALATATTVSPRTRLES